LNPRLSKRTLSALQKVLTGDPVQPAGKPIAPYRSGPALVALFNELGRNDTYAYKGGFPSRWQYTESCLDAMNGTSVLTRAVETAVDLRTYLDTEFSAEQAVEYLNKYLDLDGFQLSHHGNSYRLRTLEGQAVAVEARWAPATHASHEFIAEQIDKCDRKLREDDYDGAITNARSVVEAVLIDVESRLDPSPGPYDGELSRLYKRVQKLLNLEPDRPDVGDSLRQLLRGLASIVSGLAPLRNKMGDAHVRTYKPARHHAKLAVNAAKTLLDFVYDTFEYQKSAGVISEVESSAQRANKPMNADKGP
jgi:hypothetical protein